MEKYDSQKPFKYRKIDIPNDIAIVKSFCQKFAINWTSTCRILCQGSGNPGEYAFTAAMKLSVCCHDNRSDVQENFRVLVV